MTRIADAVKRATQGVAARPADARADDAIPFFTPGQPSVVVPWVIGAEKDGRGVATSENLRERRNEAAVKRSRPIEPAGETDLWPSIAEKLLASPGFPPVAREQYNKMGAMLHQAQLERSVKVVMLTSALSGEGKSLTAANLALILSESQRRRVLLVDADLRRPSLHELFGVAKVPGLGDSLASDGPLPLIQISSCLSLLTAGSAADPTNALTSDRMRVFVDEARGRFDWILLDVPPVGLLSDARVLALLADMTLLIALAGKTPYDAIRSAAEAVGPERLAGVILNRVADAELPQSRYRDYYDGPRR
jgi:protein-tyrosine kinase